MLLGMALCTVVCTTPSMLTQHSFFVAHVYQLADILRDPTFILAQVRGTKWQVLQEKEGNPRDPVPYL